MSDIAIVENVKSKSKEFSCSWRPLCCGEFKDLMDVVARVGFKLYLGVAAVCENWNAGKTACDVKMGGNPLAEFVELPAEYTGQG